MALIFLIFLLLTFGEKSRNMSKTLIFSIAIMISYFVISGKTLETVNIQSPLSDLKTLQLWIKKNTTEEKAFIATNLSVWESWRSLTNRPKILETGHFSQYVVTNQNYDYNLSLSKWYNVNVKPDFWEELAFLTYYDEFADQFGGNYLVLNAGPEDLKSNFFNMFIDYRNESYVLINLDKFNKFLNYKNRSI
jgi:hypothetical protein